MMKEPIVLESNQNHATITDNGICPTLPASMGLGGGYVPMVVIEDEKSIGIPRPQFGESKEHRVSRGNESVYKSDHDTRGSDL